MTWREVRLDMVLSALESGSRPKGGASSDRGDVPSLGGENILSSGGVTLAGVKLVPEAFHTRMTKGHLQNGDVLINKDGAQTGKVGWFRSPDRSPACINEHLFLLRGIQGKITQGYLYYTLLSEAGQRQIRVQISGSAQPGLKSNFLTGVVSEIPSLISEQAKIVEILSTVDRAIEQTEVLIAKQQRIKTGLTQDLLARGIDEHGNLRTERAHQFKDSPLGRIPVDWEVQPCVSLCREIVVGIVIRPAQYYRPHGVPVLRSANVRENGIDAENLVYMSQADNLRLQKSRLRVGDLVTVRTGYPGTTSVIPVRLDGCNCVDLVISRPDHAKVRSDYLSFWVNSDCGKRQVLEGKGGLAQQHFNVGEMRKLLVNVPGIDEQERIEMILRSHGEAHRAVSRQLRKLRYLKTALMQDLLTGKVRVTLLLTESQESGA